MPPNAPHPVNNHDFVGLDNRIGRFLVELHKTVSANQGDETYSFDVTRFGTYLNALESYHDWMVAQPQLDLPETAGGAVYSLRARPELAEVENESVNDLLRMMCIQREELCCSQSARRPCGINEFDSTRFMAVLNKMRLFISSYVGQATPLDMPESSPRAQSSGPGATGIEPD